MKKQGMTEALQVWRQQSVESVVGDNAPSDKARVPREAGPALGFLPPSSPELNPAGRVFEEVRRAVEGRLWEIREAEQEAARASLVELAADAERVRRLAGWRRMQKAVASLPRQVASA